MRIGSISRRMLKHAGIMVIGYLQFVNWILNAYDGTRNATE
jgi:hypothetical protein